MYRLFLAVAYVSMVALATVVAAALEGGAAPLGAPPEQPPLRPIPGITAPDAFPRGCVDCHVNRPDLNLDVRLSTLMKTWQEGVDPALLAKVRAFSPPGVSLQGKHPKVEAAGVEVPGVCLKCHGRSSKTAPPFAQLLHGLHFTGGEQSHYIGMFQGECTHCHKLDSSTGMWSLGKGTEPKG